MADKVSERIYLDRFLQANPWPMSPVVVDCGERPDFVVRFPDSRELGIEVTQAFADHSPRGSRERESESLRQSWLEAFARDYYGRAGPPVQLKIQFEPGHLKKIGGRIREDLRATLLQRLLVEVPQNEVWTSARIEVRDAYQGLLATMWPTRLPDSLGAYQRGWRLLNDAIGFVRPLTSDQAGQVITAKVERLAAYRNRAPNVALLVVADAFLASGMVTWEGGRLDPKGFEAVFLLHFPGGHVERLA